jgi:hypothetical protein
MFRSALLAAWLPVFSCGLAHAGDDLLDTRACREARDGLERAWKLVDRHVADSNLQLTLARERTAQACFGQSADLPSGPHPAATPLSADLRAASRVAPLLHSRSSAPVAPSPADAARPATITSCDAGGCWDTRGARLPSTGPGLSRLASQCVVQSGVANCP